MMIRRHPKHEFIMRIRFAAVILILVCASGAAAQERVLSLREALAYAGAGNPELRAFERSVLGQKEDVGIARSFLLPKLFFEERFMRTNNPTYSFMAKLNQARFEESDFAVSSLNHPSPINDFQGGLFFEQPLFAPKAYIAVDIAATEAEAKGEEFVRKREEVAFRVLKYYLGVQTAKEFVEVSQKAVDDAKAHLGLAEARFNAGLGLYSDKLRAEVAVLSAEEKLVSARKNLEVAKRALGLTLGLAESIDVTAERPSFDVKAREHYDSAALSRKDLKSLETRHRNAKNSLKLANAGYLPVLGFGGSYQVNSHRSPFGDEGDSWQLTAFLRWEIFDGTKREHERRKAQQGIAEAAEQIDGLKKQISFMVYDSYLGVDEARKGLELAVASVKSAEEGRRLVLSRYENSLSTMVDLLDVQMNLDAARAGVAEKEGAYLTAIANLGFQSGTILQDLGLQK